MIQPEIPLPASVQSLPTPRTMYRALSRRDAAYEGVFFTGVKTTGIFCRPTCKAKRPRAENVEFFPTVTEALHGGYRPCRLCRPMDGTKPVPPLVERLRRAVEAAADGRVTDKIEYLTADQEEAKVIAQANAEIDRSEERRVGKEC